MIATSARQDNHHSNFDQELSNLGAKLASCHISAADNLRMTIDKVVEANQKEHESTRMHFNSTVQALTTGHANQQEGTKRHEQLLDSLRYDDINLRLNEISESHSRTFGWVFEDETCDRWNSLSSWLKHGQSLYWINGKAGSGKSTFMKFLVSDHRTLQALDIWSGGKECVILAHYLWLSGSRFQRSMKGFLCSMLHQIISSNAAVTEEILRTHEDTTRKRSPGDWSLDGLKGSLRLALRSINRTRNICIFLDGIDEFDQDDGVQQLLDFIEGLMGLPRIKFCVSSRPEIHIERYLSQYDKLRLQDLTEEDMRIYVRDTLDREIGRFFPHSIKAEDIKEFHRLIIKKADGVFLWVSFALRSLLKGMRNEDDFEVLTKRLWELPSGMTQLYEHMWRRLNGDEKRYRQDASVYFSYNEFFPRSLFEMMVALNGHLQNKYLQELRPQDPGSLISLCEVMKTRILTRCAGLLEVTTATKNSEHGRDHPVQNSNSSTLEHYHEAKVRFLHRTARDFLLDTQAGHAIAGETSQTSDDRSSNFTRARMAGLIEGLIPFDGDTIHLLISNISHYKTRYETDLIETFRRVCETLSVPGSSTHDMTRMGFWEHRQGSPACDFVGTAALQGCMKYVRFYIDRATVSVSPYYRGYLFMCATSDASVASSAILEKIQLAGWLARNGADLRTKHHFEHSYIRPPLVKLLEIVVRGFSRFRNSELIGLIERVFLPAVKSTDRFTVKVDLVNSRSENREYILLWVEIEGACLSHLILHRLAQVGIFVDSLMPVATTSGIPLRILLFEIGEREHAFLPTLEDSIYLGEAFEEHLYAADFRDHGSSTQIFRSRIEETRPRCKKVEREQWERQMGLRVDLPLDALTLDPSEDVNETNWRERGWFRSASKTTDEQPASTNSR